MIARWTWHGGGLQAAKAQFGDSGKPWLDLSTGINPHAWPGSADMSIDWRRLPEEADLRRLEEAAADCFGTSARHVCAVPGTEIGLRLAGGLLEGRAAVAAPTYRTHGEMFADADLLPARDALGTEAEILVLANPNNPEGTLLAPEVLLERKGWLLVDEAFADTDPAASLARHVGDDRSLIVFRSFGKFFGLAGLRLGFVLGPQGIVDRLRAKLGAWPVSTAAIAIGTAAYRDLAWSEAMRTRLHQEAAALDAVLVRQGLAPRGHCPLFRLVEAADAAALFERLARRSILTRPFDHNPRWLRIGLPADAAALARLEAALVDG